jgi:hypothetical protein
LHGLLISSGTIARRHNGPMKCCLLQEANESQLFCTVAPNCSATTKAYKAILDILRLLNHLDVHMCPLIWCCLLWGVSALKIWTRFKKEPYC